MESTDKTDYGALSPSPRGIETWAPYSPFSLPEPTGHFSLLEPSEVSRILNFSEDPEAIPDCDSKEGDGAYAQQDAMNLDVIVKVSGLNSPITHPAALYGGMEPETNPYQSLNPEETDMKLHRRVDDPYSTLMHQSNAMTSSESLLAMNSKMSDSTVTVLKAVEAHASENGLVNESRVPEVKMNDKSSHPAESSISQFRAVDRILSGPNDGRSENVFRSQLNPEKDYWKTCGSSLQEEGFVPCATQGKESKAKKETMATEEELKRLRRVKNRASVEKCRAKQRMRMEALKTEMKALVSENKTLRDLTAWMDSTVDAISLQVMKFSSSQDGSNAVDSGIRPQVE